MKLKQIFAVSALLIIIVLALPFHLNFSEASDIPIEPGPIEKGFSQTEEEILWLARAVYSETKIREEQTLVAWVIRNRVEAGYRGNTYQEVVLAPDQFSGLQPYDRQYRINISLEPDLANPAWQSALAVARAVYFAPDTLRPIPETVFHFYSPISVRQEPDWIVGSEPVHLVMDTNRNHTRFAFYEGIK